MSRLASLRRAAALAVRDPREALDRARNRLEQRREPPPVDTWGHLGRFPTPDEVRAHVRKSHGLEVTEDWERVLHERLGAPWPCPERAGFEAIWADLRAALGAGGREAGSGLDADPALARAVWCLTRHLRPERVVETGVSRGITSRVLLEAMERNGAGRLWSIDLPPQAGDWREQTRSAVPERLHGRWTFLRGSSRRRLPRVLRELGAIDVFIHDSQHTDRNMTFELERAWPAVRPGGALLADDIHENEAFARFARARGAGAALLLVAQEEHKAGMFGIALR